MTFSSVVMLMTMHTGSLSALESFPKFLYPPRVRCGRREDTHGRHLLLSVNGVTGIPSLNSLDEVFVFQVFCRTGWRCGHSPFEGFVSVFRSRQGEVRRELRRENRRFEGVNNFAV